MNLTVNLNLDNAAFDDNPDELSLCFMQVDSKLKSMEKGEIFDSNGNRIGTFKCSKNYKKNKMRGYL